MNKKNLSLVFAARILSIVAMGIWITASALGDVVIGTSNPVSQPLSSMASYATFEVNEGSPPISPTSIVAGQQATVIFHVSLSWPTTNLVNVSTEQFDVEDGDDATIVSASAPGFVPVIIDSGGAVVFSKSSASNATSFDVTLHLSYGSPGTKHLYCNGSVTFQDNSILCSGTLLTPNIIGFSSSVAKTTASAPHTLSPSLAGGPGVLSAEEDAAYKELLHSCKDEFVNNGVKYVKVAKPIVMSFRYAGVGRVGLLPVVTIAAGIYAVWDLGVYASTGKTHGFTKIGVLIADKNFIIPEQTYTIEEARRILIVAPITAEMALSIAEERARYSRKSVCDELEVMLFHYTAITPLRGAALSNAINAVHNAQAALGCHALAPNATFGWNAGASEDTDYREVFRLHYGFTKEHMKTLWIHHAVEQDVMKEYPGVCKWEEINSWENLRGIPEDFNKRAHLSYIRVQWNKFYRAHPAASKPPTKQELLDYATKIDRALGSVFDPPR